MADEPRDESKAGSRYKPGNVGPDGEYVVGKGRPPKHTRFAADDGRRRGRRPKGQRNFDTEFEEEAQRKVTIREGGKERRVNKLRTVIIRAFDNAGSKGQNPAIAGIFNQVQKMAERRLPKEDGLKPEEEALLDAWVEQQIRRRLEGDSPADLDRPTEQDGKADRNPEAGDV